MAEESWQERTESATPKRRAQAREEGQVVQSREVVSATLFVGNLAFLGAAGMSLSVTMLQLTRSLLGRLDTVALTPLSISGLFTEVLGQIALMLAPLFLIVFVLALASNLLQSGIVFSTKALTPKWSRLNPLEGAKRLFSLQALNELFKSLVKIGIVGYIAYSTMAAVMPQVFPLTQQSVYEIVSFFGQIAFRIGLRTSYALIVLAVLDYGFQRWQYEKQLRMTTEEIKQEHKESDGDPQIKARVRSIMRETARKRMMEAVPKADVVVTNPTHLAIAISYRRADMHAPKVVAKGAGYVAERIKAIAQEHKIPIVENRPVARSLYRTVDLGAPIPETLYKAVAEILAYVYRIKPPVKA